MERLEREPCPWRLVDDAGGAFMFGLVGGTIWHSIGGARNAPSGQSISQAISRVKARVPILGGGFAVWGVLFSGCDCTLVYFRKKEDPWNAIISGAATGGILAARAGFKAAGRSALAGGVILAAIEGLNVLLMRVLMPRMEKAAQEQGMPIDRLEPPADPFRPRQKRQPLWHDEPSNSPLYSSSPGYTSTTNETNVWGIQSFSLDEQGRTVTTTTPEPEEKKSSWKFW